ncbi:MAG: hypothetical protein JW934_00510 [Anaerolineae bacterium]|nr:hypothetical protein [Anaerolineae bacterium]
MEDLAQLKQFAIEKLDRLSREKLAEALDFIDFLVHYPRHSSPDVFPPPDAFLECAGTWKFEPGELDDILKDIERSRLMELEEHNDRLLD